MIRASIACIFLIVLLESCNLSGTVYGTWKDDQIDQRKRAEIENLNSKLINSIKFNDVVGVKSIMSDTLKNAAGSKIDSLISKVSPILLTDEFTILDEYNVHNLVSGIPNSLPANKKGDNNYTLNYVALNKEMYVSLLLLKVQTGMILVTAIYGNYDDKWEINILQVGQYRFFGKTAMDYYQQARWNYEKGYLVEAADNLFIANQCLKPANEILQFTREKEVKAFYNKVVSETESKYHLPVTLERIPGKPKVFNIFPQLMEGGYLTTVRYLTSVSLDDSIALKKENDKVQIEVKKIFTGISIDQPATLYQAFNEMPDGEHLVKHYGFIGRGGL